jgi:hypothetical protein
VATISAPTRQADARRTGISASPRSPARTRGLLIVVFVVLVAAFAAGLWGTILRPAAYEVQGQVVARAAPNLLLVRHEAVAGLGMSAMETMAVSVTPEQLAPLDLKPGDRVRLAVRPRGDDIVLVWIEKLGGGLRRP